MAIFQLRGKLLWLKSGLFSLKVGGILIFQSGNTEFMIKRYITGIRPLVRPFRLCPARRISARRHSPQRSHQRDLVVGNNSFLGGLFKIIQVHSYSTESTRSDPDRP